MYGNCSILAHLGYSPLAVAPKSSVSSVMELLVVKFMFENNYLLQKFSHSTELCGRAPTPCVISLQLCSLTPILGHLLHRPSDLRTTHAKCYSPDPRKPDHHRRFSERSDLLSTAWGWQSVCRMRARLSPGPWLATGTQGDLSWRWVSDTSLPLHPCPPRWPHYLACPVHDMQSGVYGPAALHPPLSPDAT